MAIRITITIRGNNLGADAGGNSSITLLPGHGTGGGANQLENIDVRNMDGAAVGGTLTNTVAAVPPIANSFRHGPNFGNDTLVTAITGGIQLTLPTAVAQKVANYIKWKDLVKAKGAADIYQITLLNINYDDTVAVRGAVAPAVLPTNAGHNTIELTEASFVGGLTADNFQDFIEIDKVKNDAPAAKVADSTLKFSTPQDEKKIFKDTEDLVSWLEKGIKDFTFDFANIDTEIASLEEYTTGAAVLPAAYNGAGETAKNAKKILYGEAAWPIPGAATGAYYKGKIDTLLNLLKEFKIWKEVAGVDTVKRVLQANANGFTITDRAGTPWGAGSIATVATNVLNLAEQKKTKAAGAADTTVKDFIPDADGRYKGFLIYGDDGQDAAADAGNTVNGTHIFGKSFNVENKNSITSIGWLRAVVGTDTNDDKKKPFENFAKNDKYSPKDLLGFVPGDIDNAKQYKGFDIGSWTEINTKRGYDIEDNAVGKDDVIRLAFIENKFDEVNWGYMPKIKIKDDGTAAVVSDTEKIDNELDLLDLYHYSIKVNANHYWKRKSGAAGDKFVPLDTDPDTKEIEEDYVSMKELLGILTKTYSVSDKPAAQAAEIILKDWMEDDPTNAVRKRLKKSNFALTSRIGRKHLAIKDVIRDKIPDTTSDLEKAIKSAISTYTEDKFKNLWTNTKIIGSGKEDKTTDDYKKFAAAVELVKLLKEAYADGTTNDRKVALRKDFEDNYKGKEKDSDTTKKLKGEVWKLLDEDEFKHDNTKLCSGAWEKVKDAKKDDSDTLATAQKKLKDEIGNVLGTGKTDDKIKEIYDKMVTEISTAAEFNKATDILKKAHEILGKSSDEEAHKLLNSIKSFKNATDETTKKAWKAVNKHKDKDSDTDGYAEKAFKRADKVQKKNEELADKLIEQDTVAKVQAEAKKIEEDASPDAWYKKAENKKLFDEKIKPRALLRAKLKEKETSGKATDEEKEVIKILSLLGKKADVDLGFDDKSETEYKDLKDKLEKLKSYKASGKDTYEKLTTEEKKVIDSLIEEVEKKVSKMEKEQNISNTTKPEDNFWGGRKGIALIIVIVLVVVGAIAYFLKTKSSDEESEVS